MQQTITARGRTAGHAPVAERFDAALRARGARPRASLIACAIALWATPWLAGPATAQGRQQTVALQGQPAPGVSASFEWLFTPSLNASGQVAFIANLGSATVPQGVFRSNAGGGSLNALALSGGAAPGSAGGSYADFDFLRINGPGQVAFCSGAVLSIACRGGYYVADGVSAAPLARVGLTPPGWVGAGTVNQLRPPAFNDAGQAAFNVTVFGDRPPGADSGEAILRSLGGGAVASIALAGQTAPDTGGALMRNLQNTVALNNAGQVAFGTLLSPGGSGDQALFRSSASGGPLTRIAIVGQAAPGAGGGTFSTLPEAPALNHLGQTAFFANIAGGSSQRGLFLGDSGSGLAAVALQGQAAPGAGGGSFAMFDAPRLNNHGQVAFRAQLAGGTNPAGLFVSDGGPGLRAVALVGQNAPGAGGGSFSGLSSAPQLNDGGVLAFAADLVGGASTAGLFLGDGREIVTVQRAGAALAGKTVNQLEMSADTALNVSGQVAYAATFTDGTRGVFVHIPTLRWRENFGASWDNASAWTLGIRPDSVHDVTIEPSASLTVSGPAAPVNVRSLTLGSGTGFATLALAGGSIGSASAVQIAQRGILTGSGVIGAQVVNRGEVRADSLVFTGGLINEGSVRGSSAGHHRIDAGLSNRSTGVVRADAGELLVLQGNGHNNSGRIDVRGGEVRLLASGSVNNFGDVEVRSGGDLLVQGASISNYGQMQVDQASARFAGGPAINVAGGRITLDDGRVAFDGGVVNGGELRVTFGESQVSGSVVNEAGGKIILSGNSNTTFHDAVEVHSGGELRVSTGSTAVFFGPVLQRTGALFTGTGTKFYEGGLSVGALPGLGIDGGDVHFGAANVYLAEIGGLLAGSGFDQYIVAGHLGFGGTLRLQWWDGFEGQAGQSFDLFDWGSRSGGFALVDLSAAPLAAGLAWDTSRLYATGEIGITAVPEPGTWLLMALGLAGLGWRRRETPRKRPPHKLASVTSNDGGCS